MELGRESDHEGSGDVCAARRQHTLALIAEDVGRNVRNQLPKHQNDWNIGHMAQMIATALASAVRSGRAKATATHSTTTAGAEAATPHLQERPAQAVEKGWSAYE